MILILDFYVDEPACFGVPPYLSPYVRYSAGAMVSAGVDPDLIAYMTVDDWRKQNQELPFRPDLIVLIAGHTVPGKYLGGKIGTIAEMKALLDSCQGTGTRVVLGGPVRYASREILSDLAERGGITIRGDIESFLGTLFQTGLADLESLAGDARALARKRAYTEVDRWATAGAFISRLHPNFPYLIQEIETYRGCTRDVFCSFCTEAFYGRPQFRSLEGIASEVSALYAHGNRYFRLGRQADLLTYDANMQDFKNSFPRPRPDRIEALYRSIHAAAPDLKLLHLDNINPGLIATFPDEATAALETIATFNTAGDTAAMGLETVDAAIVERNQLKCSAREALEAVRIVNATGGQRKNGIPALLPGLNFIHGLPGETDQTFKNNFEFLQKIYDEGLSLRRINIRQVVTYRNTRLSRLKNKESMRLHERFLFYRDRIRAEIDKPMLRRVFPSGTLLREVLLEAQNQGFFLGRQLGSYPVTVKIPHSDPGARKAWQERTPLNGLVVGAQERSLVALSHPIRLEELGTQALGLLPGINARAATTLKLKPPANLSELQQYLNDPGLTREENFAFPAANQSSHPQGRRI